MEVMELFSALKYVINDSYKKSNTFIIDSDLLKLSNIAVREYFSL